jgi:RNA recognition motif-containing protein
VCNGAIGVQVMSCKILVGNVAVEATEEGLTKFLSPFGKVRSLTFPKSATGRVKGFAFVEMSSRKEAVEAQSALSNCEFCGRKLTVTLGEEEQVRRPGMFSWLRLFKA